jgi:hypothetical protein
MLVSRCYAEWPVFKCPQMAGFEVSTEGTRERSRTHWSRPLEMPVLTCPQIAGFQLSTEVRKSESGTNYEAGATARHPRANLRRSDSPCASVRYNRHIAQADSQIFAADGKTNAELLLARLLDVHALVDTLVQDVIDAVDVLDVRQPARSRAFVRSTFALIEGALSGMSAYLLEGQSIAEWELDDDERRALWDGVPDPSSPRTDARGRASLTQRMKVVFKVGRRLFGQHCALDLGDQNYRQFRESVALRDRLMHPKRSADLTVTESDISTVERARDWFRFAAQRFFEAAADELKGRMSRQ